MVELSVIIVSYNTWKLLKSCLTSLFQAVKFASCSAEIIVVDNASKDQSAEMIKKNFPQVILIQNAKNLGFGKACNQGIKKAKGKYILFLNSDTELFLDTLKKALICFKQENKIGILGIKLLNQDKTLQPSAGFFPTPFRILNWMFFLDDIPFLSRWFKPYHVNSVSFYQKKHEVDWVSGAFFLSQRDIILKAGLFDEKIFMYVEDVDLCYRIKKSGWRVIYSPEACLIHKKGGSLIEKDTSLIEEFAGIEYLYQKYYGLFSKYVVRIILKLGALLRLIIFAIINGSESKRKKYLQYLGLAR